MGYRSLPLRLSIFEFAQILLQVYRDKNLRFNLDLRTPSLSSLYFNLDLRNLRAFRVYALISISVLRAFRVYALTSISVTPSLSSLYLNLDLRNFEPFECQYPPYALRLNFFRLLCFTCSPSALFSARDEH